MARLTPRVHLDAMASVLAVDRAGRLVAARGNRRAVDRLNLSKPTVGEDHRANLKVWVRRGCAPIVVAVAAYSYEHQREFALVGGPTPQPRRRGRQTRSGASCRCAQGESLVAQVIRNSTGRPGIANAEQCRLWSVWLDGTGQLRLRS